MTHAMIHPFLPHNSKLERKEVFKINEIYNHLVIYFTSGSFIAKLFRSFIAILSCAMRVIAIRE